MKEEGHTFSSFDSDILFNVYNFLCISKCNEMRRDSELNASSNSVTLGRLEFNWELGAFQM